MKQLFFIILFCTYYVVYAQVLPDSLNTGKRATYLKPDEKEMIAEINFVRSNPQLYLKLVIEPLLLDGRNGFKNYKYPGKGYTITYNYETLNGVKRLVKADTIWNINKKEELKALESLAAELKALKPLKLLKPDSGLYLANKEHALDNDRNNWKLVHTGSNGSTPLKRIVKYAPKMRGGGENIAGKFPQPTVRDVIALLLIDTGIMGYGHRKNILNPKWTYISCYSAGLKIGMYRWIQNFGVTW